MIRIQLTDEELKEKVISLSKQINKDDNVSGDDGEFQDVVDSHDKVIGSLPRGVIWDNGIQGQTRVVDAFVIDKLGNVLLPVRSMKKRYLPGGYDFSCGENLMAGETYYEAVLRGMSEELGMKGEPKEVGSFFPDNKNGFFCFGKVYLVEVNDRSLVVAYNEDEIDRLEWKSREEILKMMEDNPEKFKEDYRAIFKMVFRG